MELSSEHRDLLSITLPPTIAPSFALPLPYHGLATPLPPPCLLQLELLTMGNNNSVNTTQVGNDNVAVIIQY